MNYILMEMQKDGGQWGLMVSTNKNYILKVASDIILQGSDILQVWETEEDPDTFLTANIIFSRNTNTGESFSIIRRSNNGYEIKDNNTNKYIIKENKNGFEWGPDYTHSKMFSLTSAERIIKDLTT